MKNWLDQYLENYHGRSPEAKELEFFVKPNYKDNVYIPWATIERMTYQQDPEAKFETLQGDYGSIVHTSSCMIETQKGPERTVATTLAHFVRVQLTFLGKVFVEDYPVQDMSYDAPKVYDQNLVNKALKRAMAKVASRGTGLGLKLYENGDLQFGEPDKELPKKKPVVEKVKEALKAMEETPVVVEKAPEQAPETQVQAMVEPETAEPIIDQRMEAITSLVNLIKGKDPVLVTRVLKNFNTSLKRSYSFELSPEDSEEVLKENLNKVLNPEKMLTALERLLA